MKGVIDENGFLRIYRKNEYKLQECPFCGTNYGAYCGDWCPLFEEPQVYEEGKGRRVWNLALCKKVLVFDNFIDKRKEKEK